MAERINDLERAMQAVIEESRVIAEELVEKQYETTPENREPIEVAGGFNIINTGSGNQTVIVPKNTTAQYEQKNRE